VIAVVAQQRARLVAACLLAALAVFELGMPMARMINEGNMDVTDTSELIGPTQRWLATQPGLTQQVINGTLDGRYVVAGLRPNANTLAGVRLLDGYDGGVAISRRWNAALLQISPTHSDALVLGAQLPEALDPAVFARLGIRYALYDPTRGPAEVSLPGWVLVPERSTGFFQVYENPFWHGSVTAWYGTELVASPEDAGSTLRIDLPAYADLGLVESADAVLACDEPCPPASFDSTSDHSGQRAVDVDLTQPAIVTFDEQFDEGWQVTVDGADATLVAVDGVWAGARVPAGTHRVELTYAPSWVLPSLAIMVLSWLGAAAVCWWPLARWPLRRRRPEPADESPAGTADAG
jgi:hypothetical protein